MFKIAQILLILSFCNFAWSASYNDYVKNKTKYKTFFGSCPSKIAGKLTLELTGIFEKNKSMQEVKQHIVEDNLFEKYFLSDYEVKYNPLSRMLTFKFDCPKPLMKVQIYRKGGEEFYTAILTENGKLFDPTYEVVLRSEGKIQGDLPNLAIPVEEIERNKHYEITQLIQGFSSEIYNKISEMILNSESELTMILSFQNRPSSVFLGKNYWTEKVGKMLKIYDYMKEKQKIPAVINLVNSKKIVVKFPDTI